MGIVSDFVIVGAGVVGLSIATELERRHPGASILVLEKEGGLGRHASGRNSGVLHAGIYYPEGTLKAKVCREGAQLLAEYCSEQGLPFQKTGKVIVSTKETDAPQLAMLQQRALKNQVPVELMDAEALRRLEPEAFSATGQALWSPETASFDPPAVLSRLYEELIAKGVRILFGEPVVKIEIARGELQTHGHHVSFAHLFNTAGLQADKIALSCGIGQDYSVLPFKGLYYELLETSGITINHHVYPVPDLNIPFLGVHFTKSVSGKVYVGPTAIPSPGRENYHGLEDIDWAEIPEMAGNLLALYRNNVQNFRRYSHQEALRFFKPLFVQAAQGLLPRIRHQHLVPSQKVGIRPQLYNRKAGTLVMDFLLEEGERSTHVLNAISPAFTCAFAFARFVLDNSNYQGLRQRLECNASYAAQR